MVVDRGVERLVRTTFRAMGTDVVVLAHGAWRSGDTADVERAVHERAVAGIERLEAAWSRFRDASDVSRCNASAGRSVAVAPVTIELIDLAIDWWRRTEGRFDPTILPALVAAGYDRDFVDVAAAAARRSDVPIADPPGPTPGCDGIVVDHTVSAVRLPPGVAIDLGGIGKGRAADLVASDLTHGVALVSGVLVDLGGDVRVAGDPPRAEGWVVEVDDPFEVGAARRLSIMAGAVATSSRVRRSWQLHGRPAHHLIDPSTGEPARSGLAAVTVLAGSACAAEVLAKAALITGATDGAALLAAEAVTGLFVHDDGQVEELPGLAPFRA